MSIFNKMSFPSVLGGMIIQNKKGGQILPLCLLDFAVFALFLSLSFFLFLLKLRHWPKAEAQKLRVHVFTLERFHRGIRPMPFPSSPVPGGFVSCSPLPSLKRTPQVPGERNVGMRKVRNGEERRNRTVRKNNQRELCDLRARNERNNGHLYILIMSSVFWLKVTETRF